jgi:hypothetical protein
MASSCAVNNPVDESSADRATTRGVDAGVGAVEIVDSEASERGAMRTAAAEVAALVEGAAPEAEEGVETGRAGARAVAAGVVRAAAGVGASAVDDGGFAGIVWP